MSCWPGSRPGSPRRMPSWRWWRPPMSWRGGRWRRRSGTWGWPSGGRRRCRQAGAGRRGCCSGWSGCRWPASGGTCRRWPSEARRLQAMAEVADAAQPGLGEDLRALALISLGSTEFWAPGPRTTRAAPGPRHRAGPPDRAALSGIQRPGVPGDASRSPGRSRGGRARQAGGRAGPAARLDRRAGRRHRLHGTRSRAGLAGTAGEAEPWIQRAERTLTAGSRARGGAGDPLRPRDGRAGAWP